MAYLVPDEDAERFCHNWILKYLYLTIRSGVRRIFEKLLSLEEWRANVNELNFSCNGLVVLVINVD